MAILQGVKLESVKVEQGAGNNAGTALITSAEHPLDLVSSSDETSGSHTPSDEECDGQSTHEHNKKKRKLSSSTSGTQVEHNASKRRKQVRPKQAKVSNYTKRQQLRNGCKRNWRGSMKRNSYLEKIRAEVAECTVDSLPEALAMMRKAGWALIRNYDKIVRRVPIREDDEDYDEDVKATVQVTDRIGLHGRKRSVCSPSSLSYHRFL